MAVITISRKYASGGRKLGKLLARRLNYDYVDKSYFQMIAEKLHVSEETLESFERGRQYRISDIFAKFFSKHYIERIVGYDKTLVEEREYRDSLRDVVLGVAEQDNVVIVGRAAHFFLKDIQNCYHYHLVASMDWRRKYASKTLGVLSSRVEQILEERDISHAWFLRTICGEHHDDPHSFHLTLNMDFIPPEKAAELVATSVQYF
ncbi:MAG: cytidylate kinase-like family protein [Desulfatiglandales bacterium]